MRSLFFSLTEIPQASIRDLKYVLTKVQNTKGRMAFVTGKKVGTWALLMMVLTDSRTRTNRLGNIDM